MKWAKIFQEWKIYNLIINKKIWWKWEWKERNKSIEMQDEHAEDEIRNKIKKFKINFFHDEITFLNFWLWNWAFEKSQPEKKEKTFAFLLSAFFCLDDENFFILKGFKFGVWNIWMKRKHSSWSKVKINVQTKLKN